MHQLKETTQEIKDGGTDQSRRQFLSNSKKVIYGLSAATLMGDLGNCAMSYAAEKEPIKIGVLHSLSGTMAISEVSLRDAY